MKPYIELVIFKNKPAVTPEQVLTAAEDVNAFLSEQEGFISRHLGRSDEGAWHDILFWESREHVMAAMEKVASSTHCSAFFSLIDEGNDNMFLFPSLMSIGK